MGVFRIPFENILRGRKLNAGLALRVPSIPLGLLTKNITTDPALIPIDSLGHLSFILEHIMNK
jgi:hypothetical protein